MSSPVVPQTQKWSDGAKAPDAGWDWVDEVSIDWCEERGLSWNRHAAALAILLRAALSGALAKEQP